MHTINFPLKELIIRLIKDDLINISLINGFHTMGFHSEDYSLNLSDTIFKLLDIQDNEELFEMYVTQCANIAHPAIVKDYQLLEKHAEEIYGLIVNASANASFSHPTHKATPAKSLSLPR